MKIAFVGKGGSGKTTLSALLAQALAHKRFPVLAIDADINQHLGVALGLSAEEAASLPPMGLEIERIKTYARGDNHRIRSAREMLKTTPPGFGSRLLNLHESNPVFDYFSKVINGVRVMVVGPFEESDLGIRCYHSKTGSVELLLNHLTENEKEYVIVDMTAGADSFASGLFTRFDMTFVVVEPTQKSVGVYKQYATYTEGYDVSLQVIGNKVDTPEDRTFIQQQVGDALLACIPSSPLIRQAERGVAVPFASYLQEFQEPLQKIIACVDAQQKDWKKFYRQAVEFHIKNAKGWGNREMGVDLTTQIDPEFSY